MKTTMTVRYVSGREERYEVELWGGAGGQDRLKAFVADPSLALRVGDEVVIIPGSAVECVTLKVPKGDPNFDPGDLRPATRLK